MIYTIKSFLGLLLATTILTMGNGLLNSLLSINMSLYGYSEQIIGLVMSCNYLGIILGIFFCQSIVQHGDSIFDYYYNRSLGPVSLHCRMWRIIGWGRMDLS
jgi:hypothetical protein